MLRAPVDGSGPVTVLFDYNDYPGSPDSINTRGLTTNDGSIYWADSHTDQILRGAVDGSGAVSVVYDINDYPGSPTSSRVEGLTLDGGFIYWTDTRTDQVLRGPADGSGPVSSLYDTNDYPGSPDNAVPIGVAVESGFVYWADGTTDQILRGPMDGSGSIEVVYDQSDYPETPDLISPSYIVLVATRMCDFDGDDSCNISDLNAMLAVGPVAPGVPATGNEDFDLNDDGVIDNADVDEWLAIAAGENGFGSPYKRGDADLDGTVDGEDFLLWNGDKFTSVLEWDSGDFNADGIVDGEDFLLWNNNKFTSSDVASVPEPCAGILLISVLIGLAVVRRS